MFALVPQQLRLKPLPLLLIGSGLVWIDRCERDYLKSFPHYADLGIEQRFLRLVIDFDLLQGSCFLLLLIVLIVRMCWLGSSDRQIR